MIVKIPFMSWTGKASLEVEIPDDTAEPLRLKAAIEISVGKRANLRGANLRGADLGDADLRGANLRDAYLRDANLGGKKLIGVRPIFIIGPLGSDARYLTAYLTDGGVMVRTGCFFGTLEEFSAAVTEKHGDNTHGREYRAVIAMIEAHAAIWTPAGTETKAAE